MGNKRNEKGFIIKTYSFKIRDFVEGINREMLIRAMQQYTDDYNKMSDWIINQSKLTIGEFTSLLSLNKHKNVYYKAAISDSWKNRPFLEIFLKGFSGNNRLNLIYTIYKATMGKKLSDNMLGMPSSIYEKHGYAESLCSNYATKMSGLKIPKLKRIRDLSECDDKTIAEQVICEKQNYKLSSADDFKKRIEYLKEKENPNNKIIERLQTLYEYYNNNTKLIEELESEMRQQALIKFNGCKRNEKTMSFHVNDINYKIERKNGKYGYIFTIKTAKKKIVFDVWGRKDTIDCNGNDIVDVINGHKEAITFKVKDNDIYIDITVDLPITKTKREPQKVVGVDANTKHMILCTNILEPNKLDRFVNLYDEFCKSADIQSVASAETKRNFKDLSKFANFGPIEYNTIFAQIFKLKDKDILTERAIKRVLQELARKYSDGKHEMERIYIQCVFSLREHLKHYILTSEKYSEKASEYYKGLQFNDISTDSKETMDKRRFDKSLMFNNTADGAYLYQLKNKIGSKIVECKNNIIRYAYKVFVLNGYDTVSLENLEDATIQRPHYPTHPNSLLDYYKLRGKSIDEAKNNEKISNHTKYYNLVLDDGGKVSDISFTKDGLDACKMARARDYVMKSIHFAESKDEFTRMSNNDELQIALVPSNFTSMMDSINHCILLAENPKTKKMVIASRERVRKTQEKHCNGLNADYNSSVNIAYMVENKEFRETFLKETIDDKYTYKTALYNPSSAANNSQNIISKLKKMGKTSIIE